MKKEESPEKKAVKHGEKDSHKAGKKESHEKEAKGKGHEKKEAEKAGHREEKPERTHKEKEAPEKGHEKAGRGKAEKEAGHEKAHREKAKEGEKAAKEEGHEKAERGKERPGKEEGKGEGQEKARKRHREKPKKGKAAKKHFVELKPAEVVEAIVHLANEGHSQSEIGMILRDQYGIPKVSKVVGKKLQQVLQEQGLLGDVPEDLMHLIRKSVMLREHLERNRKDMTAKRGLMLTVSKIRALEKYYKRSGKLPMDWRYTPETAALLAK